MLTLWKQQLLNTFSDAGFVEELQRKKNEKKERKTCQWLHLESLEKNMG